MTRQVKAGAAVPAFTCYGADTALAVVAAAEALRLPVVLLVAPSSATAASGPKLIATLRHIADDSAVPVCVQLDHAKDEAVIRRGIDAGADAVLADGSHLPPEDNAAFVRRVRQFARPAGVVVEAELGSVPGAEDQAGAHSADMAGKTDPATVSPFLTASGAQLLACGVGNVHGLYRGEPALDWRLLAAIRAQAGDVPLVLHGASGLAETDLRAAASAGVGKVNVNTELRTAMLDAIERNIAACRSAGEDMLTLAGATASAADEVARHLLSVMADVSAPSAGMGVVRSPEPAQSG
ncbi:class II fructose-bisphosphate aldolase [Amycolatopsis endophytica]